MELLYGIFIDPWIQMVSLPDFFVQVLWEGFVSGVLYSLIALGFVLIFKASGVFNFAQGIMVVFAALAMVGIYELGVPGWLSVIIALGIMYALAFSVERFVMRPLVGQDDIILFMATIGLTFILIGGGQAIFGGEPKAMLTSEIGLPSGDYVWEMGGGIVIFQKLDIAATVIAGALMTLAQANFYAPLLLDSTKWVTYSRCARRRRKGAEGRR